MRNCAFGTAPEVAVLGSRRRAFTHTHMPSPVRKADGDLTNAAVTLPHVM